MINLRRIDLNLLVILQALLAERSATRAGVRLGLGQPAVSGALGRLRGLFGDQLLQRTPKGLEPTPFALSLVEPLDRLLSDAAMLVGGGGAFDPARLRREFRLGLADYTAHLLLPGLISRLAEEAPGVDISILDGVSGANAGELLDRRDVDLVATVGLRPSVRIGTETMWEDGWRVIARIGHPLWDEPLTPATLAGWRALLVSPEGDRFGIADKLLAAQGLERRIVLTLPQFLTAPAVLSATDTIALMPTKLADAVSRPYALRVAAPPFPDTPTFRVSLAWRRRDESDPAVAWLRTLIVSGSVEVSK